MKQFVVLLACSMLLSSCGLFQKVQETEIPIDLDKGHFKKITIEGTEFTHFDFVTNTSRPSGGDYSKILPVIDTDDSTVIILNESSLFSDGNRSIDIVIELH